MGFRDEDKILIKNSHDSKGTDGTMPKERYQFPEKGWGKSGLSCSVVSARDKSVVWMNWNSSSLMSGAVLNSRFLTAIDQWQGKLRACVYAKGGHYEYTAWELTMLILSISVTLNVTCLTVASLITIPCQQRGTIHSCSFYMVVHKQIWGLVVDSRVHLVAVNFCLQQWNKY